MAEALNPGAAAGALRAGARVVVGDLEIVVAAEAIVQALTVAETMPLPRRAGAVCEAVATRWGVLPLVDLALWLPLGPVRTEGRLALVLRDEAGRTVAVRVSALRGVRPVAGLTRLHQDERPEELFQSAACGPDGGAPAPWLEVPRLVALSQLWAPPPQGGAVGASPALEQRPAPRAEPHAVLWAGGHCWALPADRLMQALPMPPLDYTLPGGPAVRGIVSWRGRKLPVLDLATWARLQGRGPVGGRPAEVRAGEPVPGSRPMLAVLAKGPLRLALRVDGVQQLLRLAVANGAAAPQRVSAPGLGEVEVIDVDALFAQVPEAEISRAAEPPAEGPRSAVERGGLSAHLLFEADATYAAPVRDLVQVLPLPAALGEQLRAEAATTLPWQGAPIPLVPLPAFSGRQAAGPARVALVLRLPTGQHAALAVQRLLGWVGGSALEQRGLRSASTGQLPIVTVTRDGARQSHVVVDLAEVALALT